MSIATPARSARNANPCNIERGQSWRGLLPFDEMNADQRAEQRFAVFAEPKWGFRAAVKLIRNYRRMYGHNTVRRIITRWAPANENNTAAYVKIIAKAAGVEPDDIIDVEDDETAFKIVKAMATHETGAWDGCWTDDQLREALAIA